MWSLLHHTADNVSGNVLSLLHQYKEDVIIAIWLNNVEIILLSFNIDFFVVDIIMTYTSNENRKCTATPL